MGEMPEQKGLTSSQIYSNEFPEQESFKEELKMSKSVSQTIQLDESREEVEFVVENTPEKSENSKSQGKVFNICC